MATLGTGSDSPLFENSTISNLSRNHFLIVGSDFFARAGISPSKADLKAAPQKRAVNGLLFMKFSKSQSLQILTRTFSLSQLSCL